MMKIYKTLDDNGFFREQTKLENILHNLNVYDGTSNGQKDV